jgi:predicted HAD superfamily phosphohydrolase YqeG
MPVSRVSNSLSGLHNHWASDLNDISFQALHDRGFKGVVFDKDNTLTVPHDHEIAPHLQVRSRPLALHRVLSVLLIRF